MRRYYTDKEVTERLKAMTVICDKREQENKHILDYFDAHKIPRLDRSLETGDYSAMLGDDTLETDVCVERKGSLDELAANLTADRQRFEDEMIRAKANGIKVFLLVEDAEWADIINHNYRSKLLPKSFSASLLSWQSKYNVTLLFCRKQDSGYVIHGILWYWAKAIMEGEK
jgi:ERCC4-type nuclease